MADHEKAKEYLDGLWFVECKCGERFTGVYLSVAISKLNQHLGEISVSDQHPDSDQDETERREVVTRETTTEDTTHPEGNDDPAAPHVVDPERVETTTTVETTEGDSSSDD